MGARYKFELGGKPVKRVIVTHMHPDHVGLAHWLCARWNAPLEMSMTDYMVAKLWSIRTDGGASGGEQRRGRRCVEGLLGKRRPRRLYLDFGRRLGRIQSGVFDCRQQLLGDVARLQLRHAGTLRVGLAGVDRQRVGRSRHAAQSGELGLERDTLLRVHQ